jgi:hypothetical protein
MWWKMIVIYTIGAICMYGILRLSVWYNRKYFKTQLTFWDKANGITPELKNYFQNLVNHNNIRRRTIGRP